MIRTSFTAFLFSFALCFTASCKDEKPNTSPKSAAGAETKKGSAEKNPKLEMATLGAGCYWCIEAVLERTDGVKTVVSGFMGGHVKDPSYRAVVTGQTGHAEVVQVSFDPKVISYEKLISLFWKLHDPTTLNRQGADVGTQYRSAIFYHSDEQKKIAEASKKKHAKDFDDPIVTEITKASEFYKAKEDHQNFYTHNKNYGYSRVVIEPKLKKLGLEKKEPSEK